MVVAFTGPSKLTRSQELAVVKAMEDLRPSDLDVWRSGCAYGVDTIAAHQADIASVNVELYVPGARHNDMLVHELRYRATIINCPTGNDASGSYRLRNEIMIDGADLLVAFLKRDTFYRSGEWMTVNLANKLEYNVPTKKVII